MTTAHTPVWSDAGHSHVNLVVQFDWLPSEVPFSASADDSEAHGRELYARAIAGEFGAIAEYVAPTPTAAQIIKALSDAVQAHLDAAARARGYDDIVSACSYAAVANPFQAESQAFLVWRADCWTTCYQIMAEVEAGTHAVPSAAELIAALPALVLP